MTREEYIRWVKEPPSALTVALHEKGWIWNLDWTWTDPKTKKRKKILEALKLGLATGITQSKNSDEEARQ